MRRASLFLAVLILAGLTQTPPVFAQPTDAAAILKAVQSRSSRIEDYTVVIRAVIKMTGLSVPPMDAVMYFKKPDRVQLESDGFAMLPRDAVAFHPTMFETDAYDMVVQGSEKIQGIECTKVKLLARSDTTRLQRAMLFVDTKRALILRVEFDPGTGTNASALLTYTHVDGKYWLPSRIDVEMDSPRQFRRPGRSTRPDDAANNETAHIRMTYRNYVVNKGIDDAVFETKTTPSTRPSRN
ncbi:MAG: hypothetical protein RBU27_12925 [Bacteroidota bacterium]|jgi:hypothetical protein|nr:hypothetical protein [Bacteroidota bacterium]